MHAHITSNLILRFFFFLVIRAGEHNPAHGLPRVCDQSSEEEPRAGPRQPLAEGDQTEIAAQPVLWDTNDISADPSRKRQLSTGLLRSGVLERKRLYSGEHRDTGLMVAMIAEKRKHFLLYSGWGNHLWNHHNQDATASTL